MSASFTFETEDGGCATVSFSVTKDKGAIKPYGICASIVSDHSQPDRTYAACRYFTYEEACRTIDYLCINHVMPCTLCDII